MPIRMSGMVSGLDTESLVTALTQNYKTKVENYKKEQTRTEWKQDAWKSINTKVYSVYNKVGNLRFNTAYNMKKTTVSDTTKATITAGENAINGSQTLKINKLAKSGYITGAKLSSGTTSSSTLASLGYTGGDTTITIKTAKGSKDVTVGANTKISDIVDSLNDAGLKANFDSTNKRFFVSAANTGTENDFSLTASDVSGLNALNSLGLSVSSEANDAAYKASAKYALGTMGVGPGGTVSPLFELDSDGNIVLDSNGQAKLNAGVTYSATETKNAIVDTLKNLAKAYEDNKSYAAEKKELQSKIEYTNAKDAVEDIKTKNGGAQLIELMSLANQDTTYVDTNGDTYTGREEVKDTDGNVTGYSYYNMVDDGSGNMVKDEANAKFIAESATQLVTAKDKITELAKSTDLGLITDTTNASGETISDESALNTLKSQLKTVLAVDDNDTYTAADKAAFYLSGGVSAAETRISDIDTAVATNNTYISDNSYWDQKDYSSFYTSGAIDDTKISDFADSIVSKIETAKDIVTGATTIPVSEGATRVEAQDAEIVLNGAEFTSASNTFEINGLTIKALATTAGEELSINTDTDVDGLYDKIKDFFSEYNSVINELTKLYNAESASGYDPLTDDEKNEMSDSEIEKWETKAKDALLRKDSTLRGVMDAMTSAMSSQYTINGKNYALSSFGISTLGYLNATKNEQYAYHIDGDEDDTSTSGKTDKLRTAIANNPDDVIEFMKELSRKLYENLDVKMKSTDFSSAYTVYNDKQMTKDYNNYKTLISTWEKKLETAETKYYKQFSSMESALAKLQSSSSSVTSMLG